MLLLLNQFNYVLPGLVLLLLPRSTAECVQI